MMAKLLNKTKNQVLAQDLKVADTFTSRSVGLLGKKILPVNEALWIKHCRSIHTLFMNFTIDAAFVDRDLRVRAIYHKLAPWKLALPMAWKVNSVFELNPGVLMETKTEVGDQLHVVAEDS